MKKIYLLAIAILMLAKTGFGQTTATDFTATDCNGTSHNLFTELAEGKVVVLVWVMPCASCINDAKGAYDAVQSFAETHPGKVVYYMIDDNGGTSCASLTSWANNNNIKNNVTFFRNQGEPIDEDNFGGTGMPHVTVVGPDKKIHFNVRDGRNNRTAITEAIEKALLTTSVNEEKVTSSNVAVYPNPAKEKITLRYHLQAAGTVNYEICNALGQTLSIENIAYLPVGEQEQNIQTSQLGNGVYFLKITTANEIFLTRFVVAK